MQVSLYQNVQASWILLQHEMLEEAVATAGMPKMFKAPLKSPWPTCKHSVFRGQMSPHQCQSNEGIFRLA